MIVLRNFLTCYEIVALTGGHRWGPVPGFIGGLSGVRPDGRSLFARKVGHWPRQLSQGMVFRYRSSLSR
jgi:hypothetical protein